MEWAANQTRDPRRKDEGPAIKGLSYFKANG